MECSCLFGRLYLLFLFVRAVYNCLKMFVFPYYVFLFSMKERVIVSP
uniref:Uncharacterized protein n=1 Tax=Arundo donax TaxID=35708 RepID=A0A0A9DUR2_ARUDO